MRYAALAIFFVLCACAGVVTPASSPRASHLDFAQASSQRYLYVAGNAGVNVYPAPAASSATPSAWVYGSQIPSPRWVAVGPSHLFVANASPYELLEFAVPVFQSEKPRATITTTDQPSAIAYYQNVLYAIQGGNTIVAYATPFVKDELPNASVPIACCANGITVDATHVYVSLDPGEGSAQSILVFSLPLQNNETPSVTMTLPLSLAQGLTVSSTHLLVADRLRHVFQFRLPIVAGERPGVTLSTPQAAFGLASDGTNLYVSTFQSGAILIYPLPLKGQEQAAGAIEGLSNPLGMAISK